MRRIALREGVRPRLSIRQVRGPVSCALLAALTLASFFPLSAEWDPNHGHALVGGDAEEQARALAVHLKGDDKQAARAPEERDAAYVLAIQTDDAAEAVWSNSGAIALDATLALPVPLPFVGLIAFPQSTAEASPPLVPDPPPRVS